MRRAHTWCLDMAVLLSQTKDLANEEDLWDGEPLDERLWRRSVQSLSRRLTRRSSRGARRVTRSWLCLRDFGITMPRFQEQHCQGGTDLTGDMLFYDVHLIGDMLCYVDPTRTI